MKILNLPIADLHQDPANARKHPDRNLDSIKASLQRFGQQTPVVVDANNVVRKGNGTMLAARALGWDTLKAVRTKLVGVDATAYAIADNRTSELAEWDEQVLAETLEAIRSEPDFPIEATGYSDADVASLLERMANAEVDWDESMEALPDGDKSPFESMTFTLTQRQAEVVKAALANAKSAGGFPDTGNENSNGNALARICESYA